MAETFDIEYKKLNKAQKDAVDTIDGPVMVVAGPGTGKTQVIALRIGHILKQTDTAPDGVLCLTFTNAGVEAMRKRLHAYIGPDASRVTIATFHSFGIKLIEEFFHVLGFSRVPKTLDDAETIGIVDQILNGNVWEHIRPRGNASMYFHDLKSLISLLKRERMTGEEFLLEIEKEIENLKNNPESISSRGESKGKLKKEISNKIESLEKTREVVKFYELYEEAKRENAAMDYDDILANLVTLVKESDDVRDTLRERYLYVLVDEHQDSSGVQNEFLSAVWGDVEKPNVFVVGDDRQLIYGFGGASLSHFEKFKNTFSGVKVINLEENYRSTQIILDAADTLLKSALTKEKLKSQSKEKHDINLVECEYPRDEVIAAGLFFKERIESGIPASECALLLPKNSHVRTALATLADMGLPVSSTQAIHLFDTREFKSIFTILKILDNPYDAVAIGESVLDPISKIPPLVAHEFLHKIYTRNLSIQSLLDAGTDAGLLGMADPLYVWGEKLEENTNTISGKSLYQIVQLTGYNFLLENSVEHESYIRNVEVVRTLIHLAESMEEKNAHATLHEFVQMIERLQEYGEDLPLANFVGEKGVRVLTLHGSKGLEFDVVWIAHMNERALMSSKKMGFALPESVKIRIEEKNEEVAKRELYVAITRAKRFCTISYSKLAHKGSEERIASIIEALPQELFVFSNSGAMQKKIMDAGVENYVASKKLEESPLSKAELVELVKENYHKKKVSVTLLNNFFECPWKWYFRSFLQVPEPLSESLIFGSVVHCAVEYVVKNKNSDNQRSLQEIIAQAIEENHIIDQTIVTRMTREAEKIMENFSENVLPNLYDSFESEKALSYKDPQIPNITITGKIDLVEYDEANEVRVTDWKTGKTKTGKDVEKQDDEGRLSSYMRQLAMYSYLLNNASKGNIKVSKSRLYFVEEKNSKNALYETNVTGEHIELLVKDMQDYDGQMQNGKWTERECNFKPWGSGISECPYCKMAEMYK